MLTLLSLRYYVSAQTSVVAMCESHLKAADSVKGRYRNPAVRPAWYRSRQRMITRSQRQAMQELWPALGITWKYGEHIDLDDEFGRDAPRVLEIGTGNGEAIEHLAKARPHYDFLGVDWYRGGVASSLRRINDAGLTNVRLVRGDAATLLETYLPARPLFDEVRLDLEQVKSSLAH